MAISIGEIAKRERGEKEKMSGYDKSDKRSLNDPNPPVDSKRDPEEAPVETPVGVEPRPSGTVQEPEVIQEFQKAGLWLINKSGKSIRIVREKWDNQAKAWVGESQIAIVDHDATELEMAEGQRTAIEAL